jgi:glycerol-3-phosphate acyltransferase PlsY
MSWLVAITKLKALTVMGAPQGGRTRADKIGVGAGVDIVVATSTTQVWCTHIPTKSVSAPAAISVVLIFHVIFMARQYRGPTGQS